MHSIIALDAFVSLVKDMAMTKESAFMSSLSPSLVWSPHSNPQNKPQSASRGCGADPSLCGCSRVSASHCCFDVWLWWSERLVIPYLTPKDDVWDLAQCCHMLSLHSHGFARDTAIGERVRHASRPAGKLTCRPTGSKTIRRSFSFAVPKPRSRHSHFWIQASTGLPACSPLPVREDDS